MIQFPANDRKQGCIWQVVLSACMVFAGALLLWGAGGDRPVAAMPAVNTYALPIDLDRGAAGLARSLAQLHTRASMLMITAHPDDEDGGMLALESRLHGTRTALLTLTRGEGGQNAMTTDFYDALGLIRTQELLQAGRYYGVDQYWGTVIDYGFSKTREEALSKWGYERVLADAVRVVRLTRPMVITAVFAGAPTDGHGNHQVSGQMAQEVFEAAGDPNRFPEQLRQGLRPWKPLKMYGRVPFVAATKENTIYDYATDKYVPVRFYDYLNKQWINHTPSVDLTVAEGRLIPAAGVAGIQAGRQGWGFQKSQNGGATLPPPSLPTTPYHRYGSRVPTAAKEKSFFEGIDTSLPGLVALASGGDTKFLRDGLLALEKCVERAGAAFQPEQPAAVAQALADGLKQTRALAELVDRSTLREPGKTDVGFELERKAEQFEHALTLALGLSFQAVAAPQKEAGAGSDRAANSAIVIPGQQFGVQCNLINLGATPVRVERVSLAASDGKNWRFRGEAAGAGELAAATESKPKFTVIAPEDAVPVRPYYERPNQEQPYYDILDERYRNLSFAPYPLTAAARVSFQGIAWDLKQVVQSNVHVDNVGIEKQPLLVEPALSLAVSPPSGVVPLHAKAFTLTCTLHNNVKGEAKGKLRLQMPSGWRSEPDEYPFTLARDGDTENFRFRVTPGHIATERYQIRASAEFAGKRYEDGYRLVGYSGLRPYPFYRPATYVTTGVDVTTAPALRVAFLPGTGDDVPQALRDLGLDPVILSGADLENADLHSYDAIVLGVRAYSVRSELRSANDRLLAYVKQGGVLIVQYNLQNLDDGYTPYEMALGTNPAKVVNENSDVHFLNAANPILNWPNKITPDDFKNWEEERGHGFPKSWDKTHYEALFETHDPEQNPQQGGLLVAKYGEGLYIYDAFALYRQLPAGVPGAYRLLANLVSAGKNVRIRETASSKP
jgi:LmbE family N-acetylglucosaminyl deacetylase